MRMLLSAILVCAGVIPAVAQSIEVRIISAIDDNSSFGDKKVQCKLGFEITNNAWGTLHRISVPLGAIDDRGRGVDKLLSASAANTKLFTWIPVAKGQTVKVEGDAIFKEECKYISKVFVDGKVSDENCAIRMMPEGVSCGDIVQLTSAINSIDTALNNPSTNGLVEPVARHLAALAVGNFEAAYAETSEAFQRATSVGAFRNFVGEYPALRDAPEQEFPHRNIDRGNGYLRGILISSTGGSTDIEYSLVKEKDAWKINYININPAN